MFALILAINCPWNMFLSPEAHENYKGFEPELLMEN